MASPKCPECLEQEYPHAPPGEEGDGNADEEETKESNHSSPGDGPREDVPGDPLCQEGEVFYKTFTLINANSVARKLKLLVSLHALGGEPSHGEPLCQQHPSWMDGGATGPCGAEDTAVTLGSNSGEESGDSRSSHVTRGAKPHACEFCGKAYSHQGTLQQHRRLHAGERPYECPFCAKTYTWSSDDRKHIAPTRHQCNTHLNNKPFPCPDCGHTFNEPLSLLRHQRGHFGATPFPCPVTYF
ncbi:PREDICTED: zinc finger protein GLI4-like [Fulmarus glacialis]|uniref:zinc finger protein GLI4-like n=1 Tax=Fulmarus glacialis TaxID=30455 RepID=UPI00051AE6D8|nr:PREDICTED: zinc finger protein GLI4-like [Fulmarus glacialis]